MCQHGHELDNQLRGVDDVLLPRLAIHLLKVVISHNRSTHGHKLRFVINVLSDENLRRVLRIFLLLDEWWPNTLFYSTNLCLSPPNDHYLTKINAKMHGKRMTCESKWRWNDVCECGIRPKRLGVESTIYSQRQGTSTWPWPQLLPLHRNDGCGDVHRMSPTLEPPSLFIISNSPRSLPTPNPMTNLAKLSQPHTQQEGLGA